MCEAGRQARVDASRPSAARRGYDADWRRFRAAFLGSHPQCSHPACCEPATEVDHIRSVRERPDLRLDPGNVRALCKPHHSARTARDQGFARGTAGRGGSDPWAPEGETEPEPTRALSGKRGFLA
jgi:5-methylcytosine-specific restriction protein A